MDRIIDGKYKILEIISVGGQGTVYKAEDLVLNTCCAVKEIEYLSENELNVIRNVQGNGMPRVMDIVYEEHFFIVMEYIEGKSLNEYLKNGPVEKSFSLNVSKEICEILAIFHTMANPVCYLDLKPDNIILDKNNKVRLVDFGSVILQESHKTKFNATIGYAAPEIFRGDAGTYSDVYSLGKLMLYLFSGVSVADMNYDEISVFMDSLSLDKLLKDIILRCIEPDTNKRFQSADIVLEQLKEIKNSRIKEFILPLIKEILLLSGVAVGSLYLEKVFWGNIEISIYYFLMSIFLLLVACIIEKVIDKINGNKLINMYSIELSDKKNDVEKYNKIIAKLYNH